MVDVAVLLDLADAALAAGSSVPGTLQALGRALDPGPAAPARPAGPSGPLRAPGAGRDGVEVAAALRQAGAALLLGADWAEAWAGAPAGLAPLADALQPAWVSGAAPGPLLQRAAEALRAGRHQQAQEAAARLGVRLVLPLGLCFLPAFVLLGVVPVVIAAGGRVLGG
ncbi:type II secretion system F family protein [Georgenia sp. TF02-10]|uniref:type II secretion system F family protein n=1 Tax=Georgenia sp. TF02-10 TaxID=2917725 RepID=UPI001FA7B52D|nr:type II secretion system F family protein [Georgenia sp. TF02-10]UNX55246.1 type II secretion system F family protein [Georgenia sp. TF02-10]